MLAAASCSKSPEGFCPGWAEDNCQVLSKCCTSDRKFDMQACLLSLSDICQSQVDVEAVHAGDEVFDKGAASTCLGALESCPSTATAAETWDHKAACSNMLTGFRPLGAACDKSTQCAKAGEWAECWKGGGTNNSGVCAKVVRDDKACSFTFDSQELHLCDEGLYCDLTGFTPNSADPPTDQAFEFAGTCKPPIAVGKPCGDNQYVPCAKGLYCAYTTGSTGACTARKSKGSTCNSSNECADGLTCDYSGSGESTCQDATTSSNYCYVPSVCGDGHCDTDETASSCPQDCGGTPTNDCFTCACSDSASDTPPGCSDYCGDNFCAGDTANPTCSACIQTYCHSTPTNCGAT
jgi:hypothetical protein